MASDSIPPVCLPPLPLEGDVPVSIPAGAWDTHVHVIGLPDRYPLAASRSYTPHVCLADDYRRLMKHLGLAHAVLVQPSFYGFDNSALLDTLAADPGRFRGVVVAAPDVDDAILRDWRRLGVRGIRVNLRNPGGLSLADIAAFGDRIHALGWHIQLQIDLDALGDLDDLLRRTRVPFVLDHFGFPDVGQGVQGAGFNRLLRAVEGGRLWVKLSGPYRVSRQETEYPDLLPFARALTTARPDRLLWASDWPHTEMWRFMPRDLDLIAMLPQWFGTQDLLRQVMCLNPATLYQP